MSLDNLKEKIGEIYEQYKDDEYTLNKLFNYINHDLSNILINAKNQRITRENRKQMLTEGHDKFVKEFVNRNIYFYCSTTEIFFNYDTIHYKVIKEDNIHHHILSTISARDDEYQLKYFQEEWLPWKFKIKISIMKQIRELSIFTSLPDSVTIQNIISLFYETFFTNKNEVKHFLTILGDNILKKPSNNIYLISPSAKTLIRLLESQGGNYFGHIPILNAFRFKYYDHNYYDCRLLSFKNKPKIDLEEVVDAMNAELYKPFQKYIIDIFVVSCYFSNRYGSADEFLQQCQDSDYNFTKNILYLKENTSFTIVQGFINSKLQPSNNSTISFKNMQYLWKLYLEEINVPNIIFLNNLKILLKKNLNYDEEIDLFVGYTSLGLPLVSNFVKFWDENIKQDNNEYYLEIEEICYLLKLYIGKSASEIKESTIINLIKHFYSDIIIDQHKYIYGITCESWNKKQEIILFLNSFKNKTTENIKTISLYDLYLEYCTKYCKKNKSAIIIGKTYFELFISNYLKNYINENSIIKIQEYFTNSF